MAAKISINTLCFGGGGMAEHAAQVAALGVPGIGLTLEEVLEAGAAETRNTLRENGLTAATLTHRAFGYATATEGVAGRERLDRTIALAEAIGAETITFTTGGRGKLAWHEAADRFVAEIAPCVGRAEAAGVRLSLEPTSHLYTDASIAHRLADTVMLASGAGIGVGIDFFACWFDADIEAAIAAAGPHIALVQVSDYVLGDRGLPCRAVPGDGAVPVERLAKLILATGFAGWFDIEVIGPRLAEEGALVGLRRGVAQMQRVLDS